MRNSKEVEVNGEVFVVQELKLGQMRPLLPLFNTDMSEEAQFEMMKLAVTKDGVPLGDDLDELGISAYLKLATIAVEVNGLSEDSDSGKD